MTDDLVINWRAVYWKLAWISLFSSVALLILGFWLVQRISCGWYHCLIIWKGDAITVPFGEQDLAYYPNADMALWVVFGLMFVVWISRKFIKLFGSTGPND